MEHTMEKTLGKCRLITKHFFSAPFSELLLSKMHIPFPKDEALAIKRLKAEIAKNDVAASIFEPLVQGASGMRMYKPSTLNKLMNICKKQGVLCIADGSYIRFGRIGTSCSKSSRNRTRL